MTDIFISYASEDRPQAKRLAQALEQQGWSVWWDRRIGSSFHKAIEEALAEGMGIYRGSGVPGSRRAAYGYLQSAEALHPWRRNALAPSPSGGTIRYDEGQEAARVLR